MAHSDQVLTQNLLDCEPSAPINQFWRLFGKMSHSDKVLTQNAFVLASLWLGGGKLLWQQSVRCTPLSLLSHGPKQQETRGLQAPQQALEDFPLKLAQQLQTALHHLPLEVIDCFCDRN